jgi:hypothetical protein
VSLNVFATCGVVFVQQKGDIHVDAASKLHQSCDTGVEGLRQTAALNKIANLPEVDKQIFLT